MPFKYRFNTVLFLMLYASVLIAQQSTVGTRFWLGYMENLNLLFNDAPVFTIVVAAEQPTTGNIIVPATGLITPFAVPAGVTEVELFDAILYSEGSDDIDNKGLLIETDNPVQLTAFHYRSFFNEASSLLPESELGTEYLVTTPMDIENNNQPNSFVVVATADDTEVEIIPTAITLGLFPPDLPITITLDAGENYQVQSFGDLSGSRVTSLSGQPLAVFAGAREANINAVCIGSANSHIWDQCLPTAYFDDLYHFVPFNGQNGDGIKILALEDETEVFFDCESVVELSAGESYFTGRTVPTVISASGPIALTHYNDEGSCNAGSLGDPNGLTYLPATLRSQEIAWFASDRNRAGGNVPYFSEHAVTVIVSSADANAVLLDGAPLTGFIPFPSDPSQSFLSTTVGAGNHVLSAPSASLQAYAYGFNEFDAYTLNLGYTTPITTVFSCSFSCDTVAGSIVLDSIALACSNEVSMFNFDWSYANGVAASVIIGNDTIAQQAGNFSYSFPAPGQYTLQATVLTSDDCEFSELLLVAIPDCTDPCEAAEPDFSAFGIGTPCVDSIYTFGIAVAEGDDAILYAQWVAQPTGQVYEGDTLSLVFTDTGTFNFEVEVITEVDCQYFLPYSVEIEACPQDTVVVTCEDQQPAIDINLLADSICAGSPFGLGITVNDLNGGELVSINWQNELLGEFSGAIWPNIVLPDTGQYLFTVTLEKDSGCSFDTTVTINPERCSSVENEQDCAVFWPNAFSPNGDGVNDAFGPFYSSGCRPTSYRLEIYNRWGGQVYWSTDPASFWNGVFKGKPLNTGVFVYVANYVDSTGEQVEQVGTVLLLK